MARMASYRGFSGEERMRLGKVQEQMFQDGRLARPTKCCACGHENVDEPGGPVVTDRVAVYRVMPHLEDYNKPGAFDPLCVRCHLALHGRYRNPKGWDVYRAAIRAGAVFPQLTLREIGKVFAMMRAMEQGQRSLLTDSDRDFTYGPKRGPTYLDTIVD